MNALPDPQLLRTYAERRCEAAFAELARRHLDLVYSAALRMVKDPHLAQDVSQGVFVALAKNAGKLARHPVLCGWLHLTTRNIAAQTIRTETRRRQRERAAAMMNESDETDATWTTVSPLLDAALAELSRTERETVLLRYFENKSAREIAAVYGIAEEAARKRVGRAVEKLRRHLARRGVTAGMAGLAGMISTHAVQATPAGLAAVVSAAARSSISRSTGVLVMTAGQKLGVALLVALIAGVVIHQVHHRNSTGKMEHDPSASARVGDGPQRGTSSPAERTTVARVDRPTVNRQEELAKLKQRWLKVGSSNEKLHEQDALAKESARLLMCSPEILELLAFLTENTFRYGVVKTDLEVEALFDSPRKAEARRLLVALPETAKLSGERSYISETEPYRDHWSFVAGKTCPDDEFETFRTALACKSCGQEALYGRNIRLMETRPMEAFLSSLEAFQSGIPSISGRYGVMRLFESTVPDGFDWAAAEGLLPHDDALPMEHQSGPMEDPPFREIRRKLFWQWAKRDPAAAGNHVLAHPERLGPELMGEIVGGYSYQNPAGLIGWIAQFPEGPYFDEAAANAAIYARGQPGILELIAKIKDPELRQRATEKAKIPLTESSTR